jgi:hypothetical protein
MAGPDTSGYRGWWPMRFLQRTDGDGNRVFSEGFRNVADGREFHPEEGWDGEPPYPTGDLACCRSASEKFRQGYDQIQWEKSPCPQ